MARSSLAGKALPEKAEHGLKQLGARLRRARIARDWTIAEMAKRMYVTAVTVRRIEQGAPGTSLGVLATALYLFELIDDLDRVATLESDGIAAQRSQEYQPKRVRRSTRGLSLNF